MGSRSSQVLPATNASLGQIILAITLTPVVPDCALHPGMACDPAREQSSFSGPEALERPLEGHCRKAVPGHETTLLDHMSSKRI